MLTMTRVRDAVLASAPRYEAFLLSITGKSFALKMPLVKTDPDTFRILFDSADGELVILFLSLNKASNEVTARSEFWEHPPKEGFLKSEPMMRSEPILLRAHADERLAFPENLFGWMRAKLTGWMENNNMRPTNPLLEQKFNEFVEDLRARGAREPEALAAWIGRKTFGGEAFARPHIEARRTNQTEEIISEASTATSEFRRLSGIGTSRPGLRSESTQSTLRSMHEEELEELSLLAMDHLLDFGIEVEASSFDEFGEGVEVASQELDTEFDRQMAEGLGNLIRGVAKGVGAVKGFKKGVKDRWDNFKQSVKDAYKSGHDKGYSKGSGTSKAPEKKDEPKKDAPKAEPKKDAPKGQAARRRGMKPGSRTTRKRGMYQKQADGKWKRISKG